MCLFFFSLVFLQGNLKGKDISLYLTLVFGALVWRQGCFSGDSGSLFQSLPCLFAGDIKLKSNLEWKKGQKKDTEAQGATREKWGQEDAATLFEGWS